MPALQAYRPRRQVDADPPRGPPPQDPLRPVQDHQSPCHPRRRPHQAQGRRPREPQERWFRRVRNWIQTTRSPEQL